jgi:hypothetical protein
MNTEEMRKSKPGDVIFSATGIIPFTVTEVIDGHVWGNFSESFIPGECCRICGYMRRRDKKNKPCDGPKGITLRSK